MGPEVIGEGRGVDAVSEARDQVRRRDEFLAQLSHEFRNPLAAIQTAGEVLCRDDVEVTVRRQAGGIVDRQLAHLRNILDELLDLSRLTLGKLSIRRERIDVVQSLREALLAAGPRIDRGRRALQVELPAEAVWVEGDNARLTQVWVQLLDHAVRSPSPGAVVAIEVRRGEGFVEVEVRDESACPPAADIARLFEPFGVIDASAVRAQAGLGLGLAVAKALVELHGGSVLAAPTADGAGLHVVARLPELSEAQAKEVAPPARPAPLRVLVVEDNEDARQMLAEVLRMEGFEVREADDGAAGLEALLEMRPDVALLDIGLPSLDGYEVARRTRADPRGQDVLLVAVTGYGMPKDVDRGWEAGFDHYLVKPVQFAQLSELFATLSAEVARGGSRRR